MAIKLQADQDKNEGGNSSQPLQQLQQEEEKWQQAAVPRRNRCSIEWETNSDQEVRHSQRMVCRGRRFHQQTHPEEAAEQTRSQRPGRRQKSSVAFRLSLGRFIASTI